jgi:hypothetical protein
MGRSRDVLDEQKAMIRLVLRSITLQDCISYGDHDRALILPGHGESLGVQRTPRNEAEFAAAVRHLVDEGHPQVRWQLPAALEQLSWRDRQILRLRVSWGHSCASIKDVLGLGSRFSVEQHIDTLLGQLACAIWDDSGQPMPTTAAPRSGVS